MSRLSARFALRRRSAWIGPLLAVLVAAACGTGSQDQKDPATEATPGLARRGSSAGPAAPPLAGSPAGAPAGAPPASAGLHVALRGPERPVYSLIDNRLTAHLERGGGLVLPAGSAGFAKYVRFGNLLEGERPAWQLRQREGETFVARLTRAKAPVHVPLTAAQAARGTVRIRAHGAGPATLWLAANGHRPVEGKLEAGWSTLDFALPAGQLVAGENTLDLVAGAPDVSVAWIHVGATEPLDGAADLSFYDRGRQELAIPQHGRMSWYVLVPERARLTARVTGCAVRVRAVPASGAPVEGSLSGEASAIDLSALAGEAARLELEVTDCPRAKLSAAALVVPGEAPRIERGGEPPAYVVFLIVDSLRFDRVPAFASKARAETPVLDQLATTSTLFLSHYVQGNESQVSHASMWTSTYLAKHRASNFVDNIPARFTTIDEVVRRAGKLAFGITGNGYVRTSRGFGSSWEELYNLLEKQRTLRGERIYDRAVTTVAANKDKPFFLYLGFIDTHVPLRARQPWIDRYSPGYKGRFEEGYRGPDEPGGTPRDLPEREKERVRALYDANVSFQDELLGKLIAKLQQAGVWDRTMLVITADHGDELWEQGRVGHEEGQDETLLHVPLLVRYPPLFPAARITAATEGIDLLPTFADALGVAADPEWQGVSLVRAAHGASPYAGLASSSGYEKEHGARVGPWKLLLAGTGRPSLFHLAADVDETKDLFGTPAGAIGGRLVLDAMSLLRAHHATWKKVRWGNPANVSPLFAGDAGE